MLYILIDLAFSELLHRVAHSHNASSELLLVVGYINLELFLEMPPLLKKLDLR